MDFLSILGFIIGIGSLLLAALLAGGDPAMLLQEHAAIIVFGGTCGAMMLESSPRIMLHALKRLRWLIAPPAANLTQSVRDFVEWAQIVNRRGPLAMDAYIEDQTDPFCKVALELMVSGKRPEELHQILGAEIRNRQQDDVQAAGIFEAAGGYSPTMGIVGAVLGLMVAVMGLGQEDFDLAALGTGIATAFVATIYGLALANMILLPIAGKIKNCAARQTRYRELFLQGILLLASNMPYRDVLRALRGFMDADAVVSLAGMEGAAGSAPASERG